MEILPLGSARHQKMLSHEETNLVDIAASGVLIVSYSIFTPPDPNGCDNDALTPEEKANCGTNLYRTNAEIFGENCFFDDNQKTTSDDMEYTFVYTEDEGFHQL